MDVKNKVCQNCKKEFVIEPDDAEFYAKIQAPAPTFCPECRLQRRLVWRNERMLYKRPCNVPGHSEMLISNYGPHVASPVYEHVYWWSDAWDPMQYGRDYDFAKPFFAQFKALLDVVPVPNITNLQSVNSDYCNFAYQAKNCYLNFASDMNEDSSYLYHAIHNKNSFDLLGSANCERCYQAVHAEGCYRSAFIYFSSQCLDSAFIYNCHNCSEVIGCVNLRNKKYCIGNAQYTKEAYEKKKAELWDGKRSSLAKLSEEFWKLVLAHPHRFAKIVHSNNVSGDFIKNAKNCYNCFDIEGAAENLKYVIYGVPNFKDSMDVYGAGEGLELAYEVTSCGGGAQQVFFSTLAWTGTQNWYSHFCNGCTNIFGCVGLRNKQYCIFNKQYDKTAYEVLTAKIRAHMDAMPYTDKRGRSYKFGELFPIEITPFGYNETIAQEYFPMAKESAEAAGYRWVEPQEKNYGIMKTADTFPENIAEVQDGITSEVIGCAHGGKCNEQCTTAFRITPNELQYYREEKIPLPMLCSNCRHYERLAKRNPLKLWHRVCLCAGGASQNSVYQNTAKHFHGETPCPNVFETSYAPDRPEIVYCESCYQSEVI